MQISFFEEFPNKKNLSKLKLIGFPIKLYLAANSYDEFLKLKKDIEKNFPSRLKSSKIGNEIGFKIKEFIYWPILTKREGYWISPFTKRKALLRIFNELNGAKSSLMLDLELPTTKNTSLYLTQFFNFLRNKYLIKNFIRQYPKKVYLAEYFPVGRIKRRLLQSIGLHYRGTKVIKMLYHSMLPFSNDLFRKELECGTKCLGKDYLAGFGTIAKGIMGWEPILSPEKLRTDLKLAKKAGVKEVVIFRLGGLNKKYIKILK